jgi:hypothetical protein
VQKSDGYIKYNNREDVLKEDFIIETVCEENINVRERKKEKEQRD